MMFQANAAHLVGQRQQKVITVIGMAAEQRLGLFDQLDMLGDMLLFGFQIFFVIGDNIEMSAAGQLMGLKILPGKDRTVDQCVIVGFLVNDETIILACRAQ